MKTLRQRSAGELSATIVQTLGLIAAFSGALLLSVKATDPSWWYDVGPDGQSAVAQQYTTNLDSSVTTNYTPNPYGIVTVGQLKQFTTRAVHELNNNLAGGAGAPLSNLVTGWQTEYANSNWGVYGSTGTGPFKPSDSSVATVGQLKWIGSNVWTRLVAEGYTNAIPSWLAANTNTDSSAAVVGQVKSVLNFDLDSTPTSVTGLLITIASSTEADLNWTLPPYDNISTITIQASTDGGTTWFTLGTTDGTATGFNATGLDPNSAYSFQVITGNSAGGQGTPTGGSGSGTSVVVLPPTPTGLTLSGDFNGVMHLAWTPSDGATSYVIDRETVSTGTWQNIATSTTTSYPDTANTSGGYRYRVSAKNDRGQSSPSAEYPVSQYAVIDLGVVHDGPYLARINNAGTVLVASNPNPSSVLYYWKNGQTVSMETFHIDGFQFSYGTADIDDLDHIVFGASSGENDDPTQPPSPERIFELTAGVTTGGLLPTRDGDGWRLASDSVVAVDNGIIYSDSQFPWTVDLFTNLYSDGGVWVSGATAPAEMGTAETVYNENGQAHLEGHAVFPYAVKGGHTITWEAPLPIWAGSSSVAVLYADSVVPLYDFSNPTTSLLYPSFVPGGNYSIDRSLNAHGEILGYALNPLDIFEPGPPVIYQPDYYSPTTPSEALTPIPGSGSGFNVHTVTLTPTDGSSPQTVSAPQVIGRSPSTPGIASPSVLMELNPVSGVYGYQILNDLIPGDSSFSVNSAEDINDAGMIVCSGAAVNPPAPVYAEAIMLFPMPLQSKDRMITGSVKFPDAWTGIGLHFINTTTGQDLGTYANVVENMTAASPTFKIYAHQSDMFSDSEQQQNAAGTLDPNATQQKVVFYKDDNDPKLLHFATTFDDVGLVKVEIIQNNAVIGYNETQTQADAAFSSLISDVDSCISNPSAPPIVDPTDPNDPSGSGSELGEIVGQLPGSMTNPGAIDSTKNDPTALVLPLHSGAALPASTDSDLSLVTLRRPAALTSNTGTITLTISSPSSLTLFDTTATHVLANYSVDLSNPVGDLVGLASGNAQIWIRGAATSTDTTLTYTYTDASGTVQSTDTLHVSVAVSSSSLSPYPGMRDVPLFCHTGGFGMTAVASNLISLKLCGSVTATQSAPLPPSKISNDALTTKVLITTMFPGAIGLTDLSALVHGAAQGCKDAYLADTTTLKELLATLQQGPTNFSINVMARAFATAGTLYALIDELRKCTPQQITNLENNLLLEAGLGAAGAYSTWQMIKPKSFSDAAYCQGYVIGYVGFETALTFGLGELAEGLRALIETSKIGVQSIATLNWLRFEITLVSAAAETGPDGLSMMVHGIEQGSSATVNGAKAGDTLATTFARLDSTHGQGTAKAVEHYIAEYAKGSKAAGNIEKQCIEHLADLSTKIGTDMSADAVKGFSRFYGSMLKSSGGDYYTNLLSYFTDNGTLNTGELNSFLEMFSEGPNAYFKRDLVNNTWSSPVSGGLVYGQDDTYGSQILHVLHHTIPGTVKDSVFTIPRNELFGKLDQAFSNKALGVYTDQSLRAKYKIPMGSVVGNASPQNGSGVVSNIVIIIEKATRKVITSFPQ